MTDNRSCGKRNDQDELANAASAEITDNEDELTHDISSEKKDNIVSKDT